MSTILEDLQWRYATKKFDPSKKISEDQLNTLLEAARLSP
ncbi:MAG: nitroreductase family protein, partial [Bacteroidota bacterium]